MKHPPLCRRAAAVAVFCLSLVNAAAAGGKEDTAGPVRYRITGLCSRDRVEDLRAAFAQIAQVKLVAVDFDNAEATVEYAPAKAFPGAKPDQILGRLDGLLRAASRHTFGVKPLCTVPREKLRRVEIPVAGLDCTACSLAAYEAVSKLDGVERATASFREGRVTAWIDPEKTDRAKLEAALKQRGVTLRSP
jgi:copper chaperone CopZ